MMHVLALAALLPFAAPGQKPEFLLPLPGETIQDSNTAILVRVPGTREQVEFALTGPVPLRFAAKSLGANLFSATLPKLPVGNWQLAVGVIDSVGRSHHVDSIAFSTSPLDPSIASTQVTQHVLTYSVNTPGAGSARANQSLFLSIDGGYRQGMSEGTLDSWNPLRMEGDSLKAGARNTPLDQVYSAAATAIWDYRSGPLQLRTKTVADLGDQSGQTQPMHRLSIDGSYGPWLDVHVGDQYPSWSPLLMDGVRIRGLGLGLTATHDGDPWGRVRYVTGWSRRATDAAVQTTTDGSQDTIGATYDRVVQALHIGLGGGDHILWGLTFIHAIDDTTGVDMRLQDTLRGPRPRENAALGTDLQIWLWKRRIELFGNFATSVVTDNIRLGSPSSAATSQLGVNQVGNYLPVITVNSSTRGLPVLLSDELGSSEAVSFITKNSAARTGLRWTQPIDGQGRMSNEVRWVQTGSAWESFLRGSTMPAQSGVEINHASNWIHDRLFLSATAGLYTVPREALSDADRTRISASASLAPDNVVPGAYVDGGTDWTNDPDGGRLDSRNVGVGLFQTFRPVTNHMVTTSGGYTRSEANSRVDSTLAVRTAYVQNSWNGLVRWRFPAPVELRTGGQFLSTTTTSTISGTLSESTLEDVRGSLGATVWMLRRALEVSVDGGVDRRAGEAVEDGIAQWDQSSRMVWSLPSDQALRLSQRFVQVVDGQNDLRIDVGWEKFF